MNAVAAVLGSVVGVIALLISLFSVRYQRRQTEIMEKQLDKAIELKISRDLAEGGIDNQLRTFLNHRLSDIRGQMRLEMSRLAEQTRQQLDEFKQMLDEDNISNYTNILQQAVSTFNKHEGALDDYAESTTKVSELDSQVQALRQAVADIRRGVGNQEMIRAQIRGIAEQLLRMTTAAQGNGSGYVALGETRQLTNEIRGGDITAHLESPGAQMNLALPVEGARSDALAEDNSRTNMSQQMPVRSPMNDEPSSTPPSFGTEADEANL